MNVYDLLGLEVQPFEKRGANVFFQNDLFKVRVIALEPGGEIPDCQMAEYVMFYVVQGEVRLNKNGEEILLKANQAFITEPALLSMKSASGARLMGVQIKDRSQESE